MGVPRCLLLLIKNIQAFIDSVLADGRDFFGGWAAVNFGIGGGFVAWTVLIHDVDGCFRADLLG